MSLVNSRMNRYTKRNYFNNYIRRRIDEQNSLLLIGDSCNILHVEDTLESTMYTELCHTGQKNFKRCSPTQLSCPRRAIAFETEVKKMPSNRMPSRRLMHKWIQS